jgi:flagellar hook-basal body complex protein FliE
MEPLSQIPRIGNLAPLEGVESPSKAGGTSKASSGFAESLKEAIESVDRLEKESESAQASFARGEDVDLHDVLIKVEEAEVAFKTMMEVRNKLVDAYREIMRMGS